MLTFIPDYTFGIIIVTNTIDTFKKEFCLIQSPRAVSQLMKEGDFMKIAKLFSCGSVVFLISLAVSAYDDDNQPDPKDVEYVSGGYTDYPVNEESNVPCGSYGGEPCSHYVSKKTNSKELVLVLNSGEVVKVKKSDICGK